MNKLIILVILLTISSFVECGKIKKCFELSKCNSDAKKACKGTWIDRTCECQCIQKEDCMINHVFNSQTCQCECRPDPKCPGDRWIETQCKCLNIAARKLKVKI